MTQGRPIADPEAFVAPAISAAMRTRWRGMLNTLAEILGMSAGRIWSLSDSGAEVMLAYGSPLPGEGMRVAAKGSKLIYQDVAHERTVLDITSAHWSDSAEAAQGIKDYLGLPIAWPDGTMFGVIEVLTTETHPFTSLHRRLAVQVRDNIEDQLARVIALADHAQTEAELTLERESVQLANDVLGLGAWGYDVAADRFHGDAGWYHLFGLDSAEPVNSLDELKRLIHPGDLARISDASLLGTGGGQTDSSVTFRTVRPGGETRWIRSSARVIEGTPARSIGVVVDVTETHMTEQALQQGRSALLEAEGVLTDVRERLELAAEASGLGIWEVDIDAGTFRCDANLNTIFGTEDGGITDLRALHARVHPQDRHLVDFGLMAKRSREAHNEELQFRIARPNGEIRFVSCTAQLSQGSAIAPKRLRGSVMDMTEAHNARQDLERSKIALQHTEKLVRLANWRFDLATQQFSVSDQLNEMNDSDPEAPRLTQADLEQLLSPQSQDGGTDAARHCAKTGQAYSIDVQYLRPNGTSFLANVRGEAERDANGAITGVVGTVQDMSEREETAARLVALAETLPHGAIYRFEAADGPFAITYASAGMESLTGLSVDTLLADPSAFLNAIIEQDRPAYLAEVEHSRQTGSIFDCQFRVARADAPIAWLHSRAAPRPRDNGSTVWDGVVRDITTQHQSSEALRQAEEAMAAMDQSKGEFLATMSHEVHAPMNTVIGMARLALQTELTAKQRHYLGKIDASAKGLVSTVNDVLDFARIEANRLQLQTSEFTLESVLQSVSAATAVRAGEKGIDLAYDIGSSVPRGLRGDPGRLSQILIGLVDNALKFTEAGEVVLSIDRVHSGGRGLMLEFRVRDTGIGLDAEQIAGLFNPYAKATARSGRRYDSAGLRLAVCKRLVEQMGGAIGVQSRPGRGTVFQFAIALEEASSVADEIAPPADALIDRRVLVVDDNASMRSILTKMLTALGLAPQTAASGAEALAALNAAAETSQPFEMVLMDWRMPGMDGLELARRIGADEKTNSLPAILMASSYGHEQVSRRGHELGLQGLLLKPVTESTLLDTLQGVFAPAANDELFAIPERAADDNLTPLAGRHILVVDDNGFERQATADLLELADMTVDVAANGAEALERLAQRPYDAVLMDMHMAPMDGRETMRRIRRNPAWSNLPVVALTARTRIWDRNASRKAGMSAHLAKPINEGQLYRTLASIFARTPAVARIAAPDLDMALRRLDGDARRFERLLRGFVRDFADIPGKLGTMIGTEDLPETAALAHLVKSAAVHLEAHQLASAADQLEQVARAGDCQKIEAPAETFRLHLRSVLEAVARRLQHISLTATPAAAAPLAEPAMPNDYTAVTSAEFTAMFDGQADITLLDTMRFSDDDQNPLDDVARHKARIIKA